MNIAPPPNYQVSCCGGHHLDEESRRMVYQLYNITNTYDVVSTLNS